MIYQPEQYIYDNNPILINNNFNLGGVNFQQNFDDAIIDDEYNINNFNNNNNNNKQENKK